MLLIFLLAIGACNRTFDAGDSRILTDIEHRFCPDKRLCIWNIELDPQGRTMRLTGETDLPDALDMLTDSLEAQGFVVKGDKVKLYPDTSVGSYRYALPTPSVLNLRSEPRFSAELATQALLGWPLTLKYKVGDWYRVQSNDGYLGWANSAAIVLLDEQEMGKYVRSPLAVVISENQYFLNKPGGKRVQDAISGGMVRLVGPPDNGWQKVLLPNNTTGYLPESGIMPLTDFTSQSINAEAFTAKSLEWLGRPYLWGGTSPRAMDCSGFTKMVFHQFGYSFSRDASQQVRMGDTITTDPDLPGVLPGDLLFFGQRSEDRKNDRVTHVAIYLGEGRMIHASGQVKIESLRSDAPDFAPDRYRTFLVAKRVNYSKLDRLKLSYTQ